MFCERPKAEIASILPVLQTYFDQSGLLEMATGQKLHKTEENKPMLSVDSQTGEVTMKFKLPGF